MTTISRISGWGYDFILWELPYAAGLGMLHADAVFNGQEVQFVLKQDIHKPTGMRATFRKMKD